MDRMTASGVAAASPFTLLEAQRIALDLMTKAKLVEKGWTFGWFKSERVMGRCVERRRVITLNSRFVLHNPKRLVVETILHEIAHAVVGCKFNHGPEWQAAAVAFGVSPDAKCSADVKFGDPRYVGKCPKCQRSTAIRRVSRRNGSVIIWVCRECKVPVEVRDAEGKVVASPVLR